MCTDLISRQAAVDKLAKCSVKEVTPAYMLIDKEEALKELMMLPPVYSEIVTCKDCVFCGANPIVSGRYWCELHNAYMRYCSEAMLNLNKGERG